MSQVKLTGDKGSFALEGALVRDNIRYLESQEAQLWQAEKLQLNLEKLEQSDMAGLAWLVKLATRAKRDKVSLTLTCVPETIRKLAKISDVEELLPLQ